MKMYNKKVNRILNKWHKNEKLSFSLLDNPALNANFKCQPMTYGSSFDFNMNMYIFVLKIPFLILSTILDLMFVLVSVNYFGNRSS